MADETETDELNLDHGDNRPDDMKVDDTILKLAEQYVSYENRARQLNKDKAEVRAQADKIGIPVSATRVTVPAVTRKPDRWYYSETPTATCSY